MIWFYVCTRRSIDLRLVASRRSARRAVHISFGLSLWIMVVQLLFYFIHHFCDKKQVGVQHTNYAVSREFNIHHNNTQTRVLSWQS